MTTKELISLNPRNIRTNNELMQLYIKKFEAAFSYKPNCAGCTFNNDFNKLKKHVNSGATEQQITVNLKQQTMNNYKIKPKYRAQILTYVKNKRPYRSYGRNMTDAFASEFLTHGTKQQLAERRKMFDTIIENGAQVDLIEIQHQKGVSIHELKGDKVKSSKPTDNKANVTDRMSRKKLDDIATEKGLNPNDYENKKLLAEAINNA